MSNVNTAQKALEDLDKAWLAIGRLSVAADAIQPVAPLGPWSTKTHVVVSREALENLHAVVREINE